MKIEYSRRAVADLRKIAADSHEMFGDLVAEALETRIRAVVDRIARGPLSAPEVGERPGLHVVPLITSSLQSVLSCARWKRENTPYQAHSAPTVVKGRQRESLPSTGH